MTAKATLRLEGEDATALAFRSALGNAQGAANRMKAIFATAFAGISVAAVARVGMQAIELGDNLSKAAVKAGVGAKAISELAYAAKMSDIDLDTLSTSLKKMQVNLSEAGTGAKGPNEALTALGLTFERLRDLQADEQFELIADRISELKAPADRARAATDLFGKAGEDLLVMFENGAPGIRAFREEAQRVGQSFGPETLKALSEADESVKRLTASWEGLTTAMTAAVAPELTGMFEAAAAKIKGGASLAAYELKVATEALENAKASGADADRIARIEAMIDKHRQTLGIDLSPVVVTAKRASEYPGGYKSDSAAGPDLDYGLTAAAKAAEQQIQLRDKLEADQRDYLQFQREYWADLNDRTMTGDERLVQHFEAIQDALDQQFAAGEISFDVYETRWNEALENVNAGLGDVEVTAKRVGSSFSEAFDDAAFEEVRSRVQGVRDSMEDALTGFVAHGKLKVHNLVDYIIEEFARLRVVRPLLDSLFSGGGSGGLGGFLGSVFGGFKAGGGPLEQGKWYVAGERGPEPIWGGGPGAFATGYGRGGGGSSKVIQHVTINAPNSTADSAKELARALPAILENHAKTTIARAQAAVFDTVSRRGWG